MGRAEWVTSVNSNSGNFGYGRGGRWYTSDQIRKMEESIRIQKESEPTRLVELVRSLFFPNEKLKKEILKEERMQGVTRSLKQKITDELITRLRALNSTSNSTVHREVVEHWRKLKLSETQSIAEGNTTNSSILPEEAGMLVRALDSGWARFSEEIGLWIPFQVVNKENDDKPQGIEEFEREILPGKRLPPECHAELYTNYDGDVVRWGLTHQKELAYDCCMACIDQAKNAKPDEKRCNIWVYCPSETGCYSPDIYEHQNQECWLKYVEVLQNNSDLIKLQFGLEELTIVFENDHVIQEGDHHAASLPR
ncbi:OLC1v1016751C1 [Oldenlandia corymbosa var. corymbosa]|uniref:OLC1v1016751C1 n=1 Tax=Oldenlandia corymbosa var. corymbosa TaxID=529605 RepID=A0AAV1E7U3_OLDCO|nr:OLC1v1016751C1 [Oldenlandia corymbosa var. corymbosa]